MSCHKLHGKFSKKIFVDTNDPSNPKVTLVCNGQLLEAVKLNPQVANFARIYAKEGAVHEKKVVISRGDAGPLNPEVAPIKSDEITAELRTIEEGEKYELIIKAYPQANKNMLRGTVAVRTGVKEEPSVKVNVFGTIVPRVSYRPIAFTVPSTANVNWKQSLEMHWNDGKTAKLLTARTNNPSVSAAVKNIGSKRIVELTLVKALGDEGLPADVEVIVATDDSVSPEMAIPVRYQKVRLSDQTKRPPKRPNPLAVPNRKKPATSPASSKSEKSPDTVGASTPHAPSPKE